MSTIVITGTASGLGHALAVSLAKDGHNIVPFDRNLDRRMDVRWPWSWEAPDKMDVLINCAGINKIGWLEKFAEVDWDDVMDINAKGIFNMTKRCLPQLVASKGTILNIVSNAATKPMRCSAAYNASKGAALILTKQLARELSKDQITVFSVSPNKLGGTGMSDDIDNQVMETRGWSREEAQAYQLQGLLTGEETPPEAVADFITFLLSSKERHKYLTGCDLSYGD